MYIINIWTIIVVISVGFISALDDDVPALNNNITINVNTKVKSRNKRYVAFPEGSTFIATLCFFTNLIIPAGLFYEGINWGISYDLPNATSVKEDFFSNKYALKRRQRRDLYNRMETVLDQMGHNGRICIYKALCEASRKLNRDDLTLGQGLLSLFFKYPLKRLTHTEPDDHRKYHWARRYSKENTHLDCKDIFPDCSLSIIDVMAGFH
ncbi:uncharacterized protein LOC143195238 [Rhynchophorus ferrugineus]